MQVFHLLVDHLCPIQRLALCYAEEPFDGCLHCPFMRAYSAIVIRDGSFSFEPGSNVSTSKMLIAYMGKRASPQQIATMVSFLKDLDASAQHVFGPGLKPSR